MHPCSFCGQSVGGSVLLVTGRSVHICSDCVAACGGVLAGEAAPGWQINAEEPCRCCHRGLDEVPTILSKRGAAGTICSECQKLCAEVLKEHPQSCQL